MKKQNWQLFKFVSLFPLFSTFSQQYIISNGGHDILSYTLSFILAKTQKSKITYNYLVLDSTKLDFYIKEMMRNINC